MTRKKTETRIWDPRCLVAERAREEAAARHAAEVSPMWIEQLDLPCRPYNILKNAGIDTIGALLKTSSWELLRLEGFGRISLLDVNRELARLGLNLPEGSRSEWWRRVNRDLPDQGLDTPVEALDVSVRAYNGLKNLGVLYLRDVVRLTRSDLHKQHNLGRKSIDEIERELKKRGLTLREPRPLPEPSFRMMAFTKLCEQLRDTYIETTRIEQQDGDQVRVPVDGGRRELLLGRCRAAVRTFVTERIDPTDDAGSIARLFVAQAIEGSKSGPPPEFTLLLQIHDAMEREFEAITRHMEAHVY